MAMRSQRTGNDPRHAGNARTHKHTHAQTHKHIIQKKYMPASVFLNQMVEDVSNKVLNYITQVKNDTLRAMKLLIIPLKIVLQ